MLENIKLYLWDTNIDDIQMSAILDSALSEVSSILWDISYGEKTIRVSKNRIKKNTIGLLHINPISLISVWWVAITSDNYFINTTTNEVVVKDIDYSNVNIANKLEVKYISWYHLTGSDYNLPKELEAIIGDYVGFLYNWGKDIASETLGPRSVSYTQNGTNSNENTWGFAPSKLQFINRIKRFIPRHLRIYDL